MATNRDTTIGPINTGELRRHRVGTIEIQDASGRRTVQLDELGAADRALAERFGYKPVRKRASRNGTRLILSRSLSESSATSLPSLSQ
jgi:hypothetical protein